MIGLLGCQFFLQRTRVCAWRDCAWAVGELASCGSVRVWRSSCSVAPLPLPPSGPPGLATGAKAASQDGFREGREHLKCALEVLFLAGAQHAQRPSFIHTTPQPEAPIDGPQCRRRVHGYRTGCSVLLGVALRYCGESLQLSGQDGSFSSGR